MKLSNIQILSFLILCQWSLLADAAVKIDGLNSEWPSQFKMKSLDKESIIESSQLLFTAEAICGAFHFRKIEAGLPNKSSSIFIEIDAQEGQSFDTTIDLSTNGIEFARNGKFLEFCLPKTVWTTVGIHFTSGKRNWIRLRPLSRSKVPNGPAIAAGLFGTEAKDLFTLVRDRPKPTVGLSLSPVIHFPLSGQAYVLQGSFGEWTHKGTWGVDLGYANEQLEFSKYGGSQDRNQDYFAWNQTISAPSSGRIIRLVTDAEDRPPRNVLADSKMNQLFLEISKTSALWFAHFQNASLSALSIGEQISQGKILGRIGNSGPSGWPHLHLGAWKLPEAKETTNFYFSNVRISLNPDPEDPWFFHSQKWDPQEGFFIAGSL